MGFLKVSEPLLAGNEKKYLCQAIDEGELSGHGRFVQRFEEAFAKWSGNDYAVAVANGTAALETAIWALDLDEDISIPTGTIISCYIAALRAGTEVSMRDNVPISDWNKDIMRCHLFGKFDYSVGRNIVDDCSQYWVPFRVSEAGCYSLYANKLIAAGDGGVIVTNRKYVYDRARYYRNLCQGEERFVHKDLGYNFRMSNMQAAVALAQLEQIDRFTEIKQRNRDLYLEHLAGRIKTHFNVPVPWMYLIESEFDAGVVVTAMRQKGVECRRFFYPLHKQPCIKVKKEKFAVAENLWKHAFYLPSGLNLTEKDIARVCKTLRQVLRAI